MKNLLILLTLLFVSISSSERIYKQDIVQVLKQIEEREEVLRRETITHAIVLKESEGIDTIVGDMVGQLQMRPIMVREVNNILGYIKYSLNDRMDKIKAIEMFNIYTNYHTPNWEMELVCRRWNGGYRGERKKATIKYYKQVKQILESL